MGTFLGVEGSWGSGSRWHLVLIQSIAFLLIILIERIYRMAQQNINGIHAFMQADKLFHTKPTTPSKQQIFNSLHPTDPSLPYQYIYTQRKQPNYSEPSQTILHDVKSHSPRTKQNKKVDMGDKPNSSQKYSKACRSQAQIYLEKLHDILKNDKGLVDKTINELKQYMQQNYKIQAQKLKQELYEAVDQAVDIWIQEQEKKASESQLQHFSQIVRLQAQIDDRIKQINHYRDQLDEDLLGRRRASQLLVTNYEEGVIALSKMCEECVINAEDHIEESIMHRNNILTNKLAQSDKEKDLVMKIKRQVLDHILPENSKDEVIPISRHKNQQCKIA